MNSYIDFPPFYVIQPVLQTRKLQLEQWKILIEKYCENVQDPILNLKSSAIFTNNRIERSLSTSDRKIISDYIVESNSGYYKNENELFIYPIPLDKLSNEIYFYACEVGLINDVETIHSLIENDKYKDAKFHNYDFEYVYRSLKCLEKEKKVELYKVEDDYGIKFFYS